MASQSDPDEPSPRTGRRIGCWAALAMLAVLAIGFAILWANRAQIADNFIADELAKRGISATYEVERIGGRRQVLRDIVVGDPARPDLTVERAEVLVRYGFGFPKVSEVRLVRPRLHATYRAGALSFGALDPLIFTGEDAPFEFPDMRLRVDDGRALLESDYGAVGFKLSGSGHLRGGFAGELAATAPQLAGAGCTAERTTLYGKVSIDARRPGFEGPLRFARLACAGQGLAIENGAFQLDGRADERLASVDGEIGLRTGAGSFAGARLAALAGTARATWRDGGLTATYDLAATDLAIAQAAVARLGLDGSLRARRNFERIELESEIDGEGVRPGAVLDRTLAEAAATAGDTLFGPLLDRVRRQLAAEGRGSRLRAEVTVRRTGERVAVVVPEATWRGGSGATLLSLSRLQYTTQGPAAPRFAGGFATGGEGLPRLSGRIEQQPGGGIELSASMAAYEAGEARLAVPQLVLVQRPGGALGFSGRAVMSGPLPGGRADALTLPLNGSWSSGAGLALWRECTELRFDRLQLANVTLERRGLTLCPPRGTAIVRYDGRGLRVAAGAPSLELAGRLGETPIALRSGPIGFAYPGAVSARQLLVTLGPAETASTFAIADLSAQIGEDLSGRFAGTDVRLGAVALDVLGASGAWRYADGLLVLSDGAFRLQDRINPRRFEPLVARGATLTLADNAITAEALLREPTTDRAVNTVALRHDLATGSGHADLAVAGLTFDERFQPTLLTPNALGVVASVAGTITGTGRIDWNEQGITSSGRFSSEALDFAAAFGPVQGASGTIEFTDLLGLTTAPNQRLRVRSINPGIEVADGEIGIELRNGEVLALTGATWPFMGGLLTMQPVELRIGATEERRYVLEIEGLDAAQFVAYMELENMAASGTFDGTVPLVFDAAGNGHVVGGLLLSRPPGGNVSYVGQLTYEDMGPIPNFAFNALRSLDYSQMRVALDGDLIGEIVTRVRMDGVSQGAGAQQNFLTRKIAALPIRVDVNVRAPFYSLIGNIRAMYNVDSIRDPRELGLVDAQGNAIRRETPGPPPAPPGPGDLIPNEPAIQRRESEDVP
ncbi:MAG TPA: YdbH domain-containing protein [Croceibacterium sp.]